MLSQIWTVFSKETTDNVRDRRALFNALFAVLFNPLLYIFLFGFLNRAFSEQSERTLRLPVTGGENAPSLIAFLEQNDVVILPEGDNPESAVRSGEVDAHLTIPDDFAETFRRGRPAVVRLLQDESNQSATIAARRIRDLLRVYSLQVGNLRLLARGIDPSLTVAVPVQVVNVSSELADSEASVVLNLLPVVMLTAAFFGGFYLAVDMTAGERERDSLEPLLLNPVPRWRIVFGKYLAAFAFTTLAVFLATAFFLLLLGVPFIQSFTGLEINLGFDVIITAVLLMIPVVIMAVALEMLVASFAGSVKEAQTYTQLVALAGFMPSIFLSVLPINEQSWMKFVPTVAQLFMINSVSRGEPLIPSDVFIASTITIAVGIVALRATVRLYNQERIILGK